jgi:hypothetical protein
VGDDAPELLRPLRHPLSLLEDAAAAPFLRMNGVGGFHEKCDHGTHSSGHGNGYGLIGTKANCRVHNITIM